MSRLQNIIDPSAILRVNGTSIDGISEYTISREKGSVGASFTVVLPKMVDVPVGSSVEFKGIGGMVTSKELRATGKEGFATVINCVSEIGELLRRSPLKTLMYMSMTQEEKDELEISCKGDYSGLDFVPLIKICDPRTQIGGWNSRQVLEDLLQRRGGFSVVCNVYNFWVKQVQASNQSSYLDSALSLIAFLRPTVYEQDGTLYILERPVVGGDIRFDKFVNVSQRHIYNQDAKSKYFQVRGGYGRWIRAKSRIRAEAERETVLVSETYQEKPVLATVSITGEKPVVDKITGETNYEWGGVGSPVKVQYGYWLKEPMREKHTITETWRLDPFGNFKAPLSRHRVVYNLTFNTVLVDAVDEYTYDFLTEEYERARVMTERRIENKYTWKIVESNITHRSFANKVVETSRAWVHSGNGTLLQEVETKSMDVVKLSGTDGYVVLDIADQFYRREGDPDPVEVTRMVVEEKVIRYTPAGPDMYHRSITIRKLGPLARKVGEENFSTTTEIVRGRVPRNPRRYRKMMVYADNVPQYDQSVDVPVNTISNPNIVDWTDAQEILGRVMEMSAAEVDVSERVVSIPGDIPVDVGWAISLPEIPVGSKHEKLMGTYKEERQAIPAVTGLSYSKIVSYQKVKQASAPSVMTTITMEAK